MNATHPARWVSKTLKRCQGNAVAALVLVVGLLLAGAGTAHASTYRPASTRITSGTAVYNQPRPVVLASGPRVTLPSTRHSAFPGAVRLPDGRLLAVWREATGHLSKDGDIWGSYSSDNGKSWTAQTTRLVMSGYDLRDPALAVVDGVLYMTFCVSTPAANGVGVYVARSTDAGLSWTVGPKVDGGMARAAESGPVLGLADGRLMQVFYGRTSAETRYSLLASYSTDRAATWTAPARVLNGTTDDRDYLEPWAMTTSTGLVRVYTRWGGVAQIGSVDYNGTTWANAHALWAGSGRPSCVSNGRKVLCVYRALDPAFKDRPGLMRLSTDDGATFGSPVILDGKDAMFTYAAPVTSGAGWEVIYAVQTGITSAVFSRTVTVAGRSSVLGR